MTVRTLTYNSAENICGNTDFPRDVVLCLPLGYALDGSHHIQAQVTASSRMSCCGTSWALTISYDDTLLVADTVLTSALISGIICKDCYTTWVEDLVEIYSSYIPVQLGDTASRPTPGADQYGRMYMDTDLHVSGMPIFWNGTKWVKYDGTDA